MNVRRFIMASAAVFVAKQITDFLIHGMMLAGRYEAIAHVWRTDMESKMWVMQVASVAFSLLFLFVFTKGHEKGGIGEGLRYGFVMGLLLNTIGMFNQYAVYPVPFSLVMAWVVAGLAQFLIYGALAALIYRPRADA